jgi:hypothetical protein
MTIPRRDGEALELIVWEDWARFLYLDTRRPYCERDTNGHKVFHHPTRQNLLARPTRLTHLQIYRY